MSQLQRLTDAQMHKPTDYVSPEAAEERREAGIAVWADSAMYEAEPTAESGERVGPPVVTLVSMTSRPLQTLAAASEMYKGRARRSPVEIDRDTMIAHFEDMSKTVLEAPFEWVDMAILVENVTRAFTHQAVRMRTGVYVQESQRFAVKTNGAYEVADPPSLWGRADDHPWRVIWDETVEAMNSGYLRLVESGMPAEDARGLLATNITTRIHMKAKLRDWVQHAGMRLCTQAQFEWRLVWAGIVKAVREGYLQDPAWLLAHAMSDDPDAAADAKLIEEQYAMISVLFKPICYRTGKCEFMASMDRHCAIRERVELNHRLNRPSSEWGETRQITDDEGKVLVEVGAIQPFEWLADPSAARS